MPTFPGLLTLLLAAQVPPPALAGEDPAAAIRARVDAAVRDEVAALEAVASGLDRAGKGEEAKLVRAVAEVPVADGPIRFAPLGELVPARGGAPKLPETAAAIRRKAAKPLLDAAKRAGGPEVRAYSLADQLIRAALARDPEDPEARRLLGFVPFEGGWAQPEAVALRKRGLVADPTFGWVEAAWVPHLAKGELPSRGRWLPAAEVDAQHERWDDAWQLKTAPHFEVRANVPLAEAVAFGRRLESLRELFASLFADVIGPDRLPLARRLANPAARPEAAAKKHQVWYFALKQEYVDYLIPRQGPNVGESLGIYFPPRRAAQRGEPARSYFYRNADARIDDVSTLAHEVSHQLLFELAGTARNEENAGQYWVWEGLGTYFETLRILPDGSIEVGGKVGPRFADARDRCLAGGQFLPTAQLAAMGESAFNAGVVVHRNYSEAMAFAVFLMNGKSGAYRRDFLEYVDDCYRGRFRRGGPAPSLHRRLGVEPAALDAEFLAFLREV